MKIGIDLRFIKDELFSKFAVDLSESLVKKSNKNKFVIYTNNDLGLTNSENLEIKKVNIETWTLKEQIQFSKILKNDKNNTMIFFNHFKPIFYKWDYTTIVWWLKDIYYMNFNSYFEKYRYLFLMEKNLNNSRKIVCLDQNTKNELVEKFNIKEEKINIIKWFFPKNDLNKNDWFEEEINISIKNKYSIKNDYFIYSWWDSIEKNYEKLIPVLDRLKKENIEIDLVFLWNNVWKNLNLRSIIINYKMETNVHFLWSPNKKNKELLYKESVATIFPSFYEPFPFRLAEPIYFDTKIIASELKNIKNIFWNEISYFSPISVNSIFENIKKFLDEYKNNNQKKHDYREIKNKYNIENTTDEILEIIK